MVTALREIASGFGAFCAALVLFCAAEAHGQPRDAPVASMAEFGPESALAWLPSVIALAGLVVLLGVRAGWKLHRRGVARIRRDRTGEIISAMPAGILLLDAKGKVLHVNDEILQATPGGRDRMRAGLYYADAIRALIDHGAFDLQGHTPESLYRKLAVEGARDGFRGEFRMATGEAFIRSAKRLGSGETLLIRQDITEERDRMRQIERLNRDLSDQIRVTTAANADLRAFAYATSHDLKSPINTAIMLGDALAEDLADCLTEEEADLVRDLKSTLSHMAALIDGVLCFTDTLGADLQMDLIDLGEVARSVLEKLQGDLAISGAQVHVGALPCIRGNEWQIRQLLLQLLGNALKFRSAVRSPEIQVETVSASSEWSGFFVRDNGIGIDRAHHDRIFQLFQRLHTGDLYAGAGLGLAICHRVVLNHGGRIAVSSRPDVGAEFTVLFRKDTR